MNQATNSYKRERNKFTLTVYLIALGFLLLALAQWLIVSIVHEIGDIFIEWAGISFVFFVLAIIMLALFMWRKQSKPVSWLNWLLSVLIVELGIIGMFTLVAGTLWPELVMWFCICLLTAIIFILLSVVMPLDLTGYLDKLVAVSFVFFIGSIFLYMWHLLTLTMHSYVLYQLFLSIIVLTFLMYHAQTINGGRIAEIRITNHLLGTVILFYHYVMLLMLTFYAQHQCKVATGVLISIGLVDKSFLHHKD